MKILVIGSGGREHAVVWSLRRTAAKPIEVYCAPGNAGIEEVGRCVPILPTDTASLIQFVRFESIDLTIVGPEAPLAIGIVDDFSQEGLAIAGPSRAASRLESSKVFAKEFMKRHNIPTARYETASSFDEALQVLEGGKFGSSSTPVVLKADGLAAGKGVIVAESRADAIKAVQDLVSGKLIEKDAARQIVIEEALTGMEASILLFSDGQSYAVMPPARDHKRIGENDTGPNTGGMGAITDRAIISKEMLERISSEIIEPTLEGADEQGFAFKGVLFIGLMITSDGPKVLEYNVRFGDPETQAILVRLRTDLLQIFEATRQGNLGELKIDWSDESSACVVLASRGYPGNYDKGIPIKGIEQISAEDHVELFHAGTARSNSELVTAGGRVLGVTATGVSLEEALHRCYAAISKIKWPGMQYRRDIGKFGGYDH